MPIYEFRCEACGMTFEHLMGPGDGENIVCTSCGSAKTTRILSAPSFFPLGASQQMPGRTCCGREERCEKPPCSDGGACRRE
jgi:putative FmdB family regulatory protein